MTLVVDCDSHVMEPADLWQTYLEPEFRDRAIRIERREGIEHLIIGEESVLSGVLAGLGGGPPPPSKTLARGAWHAPRRRAAGHRPAPPPGGGGRREGGGGGGFSPPRPPALPPPG